LTELRLILELRRLRHALRELSEQLAKSASGESTLATKEVPDEDYTVHEFDLSTPRENHEVYDKRLWHSITILRADSDFEFKLNTMTAKPIPVKKDQTLTITHKIERFYLTNTAASGKAVFYLSRWQKLEE